MTTIVGIDPGVTGAMATIYNGGLVDVIDLPVIDSILNARELQGELLTINPDFIFIEQTQPMPKNGSIASYKLGQITGSLRAVIQLYGTSATYVRPAEWKKGMGLLGTDKDRARRLCMELFPDRQDDFKRVKDHNRADAALIARYGWFKHFHEESARA